MYQYKCKAVGDCDFATRGDPLVSETLLNEPKCKECSGPLELMDEGGGGGVRSGSKTLLFTAVAAVVVAVAGGGGWYALSKRGATAVSAETESAQLAQTLPLPSAQNAGPITPADDTSAVPSAGIAPSESDTSLARREADRKLSDGQFSEAEQKAARAAALEMIKTAVAKMGQGDLSGAERELMQARERDATESLIYYNLGIVRLRQQQPQEALKQLEAAFQAGFKHFDAMDQDRDLDELRDQPDFKKLVALYRKGA